MLTDETQMQTTKAKAESGKAETGQNQKTWIDADSNGIQTLALWRISQLPLQDLGESPFPTGSSFAI